MPVVTRSASLPPSTAGARSPSRPSSPIWRQASQGNSPLRSHTAERGASSLRTNTRRLRASSSCSGVKEKSSISVSEREAEQRAQLAQGDVGILHLDGGHAQRAGRLEIAPDVVEKGRP